MNLYEKIIEAYPELNDSHFGSRSQILLQDDSDGVGAYIAKWEYSKPIPKDLILGKPSK